MKKFTLSLLAVCMLATLLPTSLNAVHEARENPMSSPKPIAPTETTILMNRLEVIKEMDFKSMKGAEKKQLRKEVRTIKRSLKEANQGVYLSVGAIIIIALVLILLL